MKNVKILNPFFDGDLMLIVSTFLFVQLLNNFLYISEFIKNFVIVHIQIYIKINDKDKVRDEIASKNIANSPNFLPLFQVTNKCSVKISFTSSFKSRPEI